ncbi:MAG TPA: C13 family peptidase [Polyangiaceae bacterium]|nr:C13 family peptidase [Polyangiaceae bacterium]
MRAVRWLADARLLLAVTVLAGLWVLVAGTLWRVAAFLHVAAGRPRRARALLRVVARRRWPAPESWMQRIEAIALLWDGLFEAAADRAARVRAHTADLHVATAAVEIEVLSCLLAGQIERARDLFAEHRADLRRRDATRHWLTLNDEALEALLHFHEGRIQACAIGLGNTMKRVRGTPPRHIASFYAAAVAYRESRFDDAQDLLGSVARDGNRLFVARWAMVALAEWVWPARGGSPAHAAASRPGRSPKPGQRVRWRTVAGDLRAGVRDLFFCRGAAVRRGSFGRLAPLLVIYVLAVAAIPLVRFSPDAIFLQDEALALFSPIPLVLAAVCLASTMLGRAERAVDLAVALYRALPLLFILSFTVHHPHFWRELSKMQAAGGTLVLWALALRWIALVHVQVRGVARSVWWLRRYAATALISAAWLLPADWTAEDQVWIHPEPPAHYEEARRAHDRLMYTQADVVRDVGSQVIAGRPGITDLYFVGAAGWGPQDVFSREARFAQRLFDERFGTVGRSIVLANDAPTDAKVPLATPENLVRVLETIGARMNRDEDVLFLLVTSHGSPSGVALEWSDPEAYAGRHTLSPVELKADLDRAGIRWRVLMISACYSGTFVEPLRDDFTLVATASAADRTSFGCASGRELTEFGRAVFAERLTEDRSFVPAFEQARGIIHDREVAGRLEPSLPQLFVGSSIEAKLRQLEGQPIAPP